MILQTLYQNCVKQDVEFFNEFYVLDLLLTRRSDGVEVASGVVAYELATGEIHVFNAKSVVLATGGFGKVFKTTSNAHTLTDDGMGVVWRKGLSLEDMEFFQFHPPGLAGLGILLSEAARGEGAILRNCDGERFMERYAPTIKDLAPRDIVARSMANEVREGRGAGPGKDYVLLDLTPSSPAPTSASSPTPNRFRFIPRPITRWAGCRPTSRPRCCAPTTRWFPAFTRPARWPASRCTGLSDEVTWVPYRVEAYPTDRVLNLLMKIKGEQDGTLTFRRSCAHGVCGSDAMRISGVNRLACKVLMKDMPAKEWLQSQADRDRYDDTTKCILCAACTTSCPVFWTDGSYFGPAAIVNAHRFIFDSRDQGAEERLEILNDREGVWRRRTTFNCTEACPRGIQITKAIRKSSRRCCSAASEMLPVAGAGD